MCAAADPTRARADGSPLTRVPGRGTDRGARRSPEQAAHHGAGHGVLRGATRGLEGELPALGLILRNILRPRVPIGVHGRAPARLGGACAQEHRRDQQHRFHHSRTLFQHSDNPVLERLSGRRVR